MHRRILVLAVLIGGVGLAARRVGSTDDAPTVVQPKRAPRVVPVRVSDTSHVDRPQLAIPILRPEDEADEAPDEEVEPTPEADSDPEPTVETSAIAGEVRDATSGEQLADVTVIVSGGSQVQVAITDERGHYKILLPPANYLVTFYYCDATIERSGVTVRSSSITPLSQTMDSTAGRIREATVDDPPAAGVTFTGTEDITNTYVVDEVDSTGM